MDDEVRKKERAKEREIANLQKEEVRERTRRAGTAYTSWKHRKDMDSKTEKDLTQLYQRALTPPSRGSQQVSFSPFSLSLSVSPPGPLPLSIPYLEPTPTLPGYCSVWSCDDHMAKFFVKKVRRAGSFDLSDSHTFDEHERQHPIIDSHLSATT